MTLMELEAANIVDRALHQPDAPPAAGPFWLARFESVRLRLSEGAYHAVREALTNWTADEVRERMTRDGWLDDSGLLGVEMKFELGKFAYRRLVDYGVRR